MKIIDLPSHIVRGKPLAGLKLVELKHWRDERGFFVERYRENVFVELGIANHFVQDNHSRSAPDVLRGLHYQFDRPQGKLVSCLRGRIFDVAVDMRTSSKTFGDYAAVELSDENGLALWIPAGFAHGFCVLGEQEAEVVYKVDSYYNPHGEWALRWNDPTVRIVWPIDSPRLSPKDAVARSFEEYAGSELAKTTWWPT